MDVDRLQLRSAALECTARRQKELSNAAWQYCTQAGVDVLGSEGASLGAYLWQAGMACESFPVSRYKNLCVLSLTACSGVDADIA